MMLQPSKFNFNSRQKNRTAHTPSEPRLVYGTAALVILRPFRVSAKRIFRLNLFLNRSARKSDITKRAFWVSIFPHLPLSSNANGMSMGNGAGNLDHWYTQLRAGKVLVEFNNLSLGRAAHYSQQVSHNLPVPSTFISQPTNNVNITGCTRTNPSLLSFW